MLQICLLNLDENLNKTNPLVIFITLNLKHYTSFLPTAREGGSQSSYIKAQSLVISWGTFWDYFEPFLLFSRNTLDFMFNDQIIKFLNACMQQNPKSRLHLQVLMLLCLCVCKLKWEMNFSPLPFPTLTEIQMSQ